MITDLITLERAKLHLRVDTDDDDTLIITQLAAAHHLCEAWIQRSVFPTEQALQTARDDVPRSYAAALENYRVAKNGCPDDAETIEKIIHQTNVDYAKHTLEITVAALMRTQHGIVVNELYISAVLLTLGALYADRENTLLPPAATYLLYPLRHYPA